MDGFNVIPIDKENLNNSTPASSNSQPESTFKNFTDSGVEIIDENSKKVATVSTGGSLFLVLSIFALIGVMAYFVFLVLQRFSALSQITSYGEQLRSISSSVDKGEIEDFKTLDTTLKAINQKLSGHVLNSQVLIFVNNNLRNNLQVTEYKVDVKEKEVEVSLTAIAPTFKEFAEQTEKLFALKTAGSLKSFYISNMSFEGETRRLRFTTRITFDKTAVSATAFTNTN